MNKKPLLILVDNQGYYSQPVTDRLEFEKFYGQVVRTFNEEDTLSTITNAGPERKYIIVTDSLTPSANATDTDRAAGTYSMIKNIGKLCPDNKVIIYATDFFELDTKLTKNEVKFINSAEAKGYDALIKKIHEYATLN